MRQAKAPRGHGEFETSTPGMLAAVLDGEGLRGLAELAAEEAGGPAAILLPARGLAAPTATPSPTASAA